MPIFPGKLTLSNANTGSFPIAGTDHVRGTVTVIDSFDSASLATIGSGLDGTPGLRDLGTIVSITGSATTSPAYYVYSQTTSLGR